MTTKISCGGFDIDNDTLIEEDGVLKVKGGSSGGGVLVVHAVESGDSFVCDKTGAEMNAALTNGIVCIQMPSGTTQIRYIFEYDPEGYGYLDSQSDRWEAASANDYPVYTAT